MSDPSSSLPRAAQVREALSLARQATNGWACYARTKLEHDGIARLHADIDKMLSAFQSHEPTQWQGPCVSPNELASTLAQFVAEQRPLPPEAAKILRDNLWALYDDNPAKPLSGKQLLKGTGDVLKDIGYAQRFTDGFAEAGYGGQEMAFIDRALRVARGEIVQLRQQLEKRQAIRK